MSERTYLSSSDAPLAFPYWGAIWAGVFTFVAIWSVFGALGAAVFTSAATPATPVSSMGIGISIWAGILTIIAMFFGGLTASRLSGRINAFMTGTVVFGLSVSAALILASMARLALVGMFPTLGALSGGSLGTLAGIEWIRFVALILGWVAAVGGASSISRRKAAVEVPAEQIRRVA